MPAPRPAAGELPGAGAGEGGWACAGEWLHIPLTQPSYEKWKQKQKVDERDDDEEDERGREQFKGKHKRGQGEYPSSPHIAPHSLSLASQRGFYLLLCLPPSRRTPAACHAGQGALGAEDQAADPEAAQGGGQAALPAARGPQAPQGQEPAAGAGAAADGLRAPRGHHQEGQAPKKAVGEGSGAGAAARGGQKASPPFAWTCCQGETLNHRLVLEPASSWCLMGAACDWGNPSPSCCPKRSRCCSSTAGLYFDGKRLYLHQQPEHEQLLPIHPKQLGPTCKRALGGAGSVLRHLVPRCAGAVLPLGVPGLVVEPPPSPGRCWRPAAPCWPWQLHPREDLPPGWDSLVARRPRDSPVVPGAGGGGGGRHTGGTQPQLLGAQLSADGSQVLQAQQHLRRWGP